MPRKGEIGSGSRCRQSAGSYGTDEAGFRIGGMGIESRRAFGTQSRRICGVFLIRAGDNLTV